MRHIISTALFLLTCSQSSFGQLSGPLSGTLGPGVFHVVDTIWVDTGDTLALLSGTTFTFDGPHPFNLYGTLLAEGTEDDSIVFTTDTVANSACWRGLRFSDSTSSGSRLAYCVVEHGHATGNWPDNVGGAVYCHHASPTFENCVVRGNWADSLGGGVYCGSQSSPNFASCCIRGNTVGMEGFYEGGGCGVYSDSSSPSFSQCEISGNWSSNIWAGYSGGGVYCRESCVTLSNCLITGNSSDAVAGGSGGGLCGENSSLICTESTFSDNHSAWSGGGVDLQSSNASFTRCTVRDNSAFTDMANAQGGGVACFQSTVDFMNCTFSSNSAWGTGGNFYCWQSSATFTDCAFNNGYAVNGGGILCEDSSPAFAKSTFSGNQAFVSGGGVYCIGNSSANFSNCVISGNWAEVGSGGGVYCSGSSPTFNSTIIAFSGGAGIDFEHGSACSVRYCDIFGNSDGPFAGDVPVGLGQLMMTNANGDSCDAQWNIFLDPMFEDTFAGDYHLLRESPCVDAGDPGLPLDPDGTVADIGAFYFHQVDAQKLSVPVLTEYALHPNWPNPFNSTTSIRYDVPVTGQVRLVIYNLLGQEVAKIVESRHLAGTYTITWNTGNSPSGVYLCRMEAGQFLQTRRLVLVK